MAPPRFIYLPSLLLITSFACGEEPSSSVTNEPPLPPSVLPTEAKPGPGFWKSGSRLKIRQMVSSEGLAIPYDLFDTQLGAPCGAGLVTCTLAKVPANEVIYLDEACEQPAVVLPSTTQVSDQQRVVELTRAPDARPRLYRIAELQARSGGLTYQRTSTGCGALATAPAAYYPATPVTPADLPQGRVEKFQLGAITVVFVQFTDGATMPVAYRLKNGEWAFVTTAPDTKPFIASARALYYLDAQCTQAVTDNPGPYLEMPTHGQRCIDATPPPAVPMQGTTALGTKPLYLTTAEGACIPVGERTAYARAPATHADFPTTSMVAQGRELVRMSNTTYDQASWYMPGHQTRGYATMLDGSTRLIVDADPAMAMHYADAACTITLLTYMQAANPACPTLPPSDIAYAFETTGRSTVRLRGEAYTGNTYMRLGDGQCFAVPLSPNQRAYLSVGEPEPSRYPLLRLEFAP